MASVHDADLRKIILDCGSACLRVGFNEEEQPALAWPTLIGRRCWPQPGCPPDLLLSEEALVAAKSPSPRIVLSRPVQRGIPVDPADLEPLWRSIIEQGLPGTDPTEHPVLLTEPPLNPKGARESYVQLLFEGLGVPAGYLANSTVMALYSSGRTSGVLLGCGEGVSHAEVIYDGFPIPTSTRRLDLAGADVTDAVRDVLRRRDCCLETPLESQLVARRLKEQIFRVRPRRWVAAESTKATEDVEEEFPLPDGRGVIRLSQRDRAEPWETTLFGGGSSASSSSPSLQHLVAEAVGAADLDARKNLWWNVIVHGGTSMAEGFVERMGNELSAMQTSPSGAPKVRVEAHPDRDLAVWVGGSIQASLSSFRNSWITRAQYEEVGPSIVHRVCY